MMLRASPNAASKSASRPGVTFRIASSSTMIAGLRRRMLHEEYVDHRAVVTWPTSYVLTQPWASRRVGLRLAHCGKVLTNELLRTLPGTAVRSGTGAAGASRDPEAPAADGTVEGSRTGACRRDQHCPWPRDPAPRGRRR